MEAVNNPLTVVIVDKDENSNINCYDDKYEKGSKVFNSKENVDVETISYENSPCNLLSTTAESNNPTNSFATDHDYIMGGPTQVLNELQRCNERIQEIEGCQSEINDRLHFINSHNSGKMLNNCADETIPILEHPTRVKIENSQKSFKKPLNPKLKRAKKTKLNGTKNEKTYEVENILAKRDQNGVLLYLVKWLNFKKPTWEPCKNLMCDLLIEKFEASQKLNCKRTTANGESLKGIPSNTPNEPVTKSSSRRNSIMVSDSEEIVEAKAEVFSEGPPQLTLEQSKGTTSNQTPKRLHRISSDVIINNSQSIPKQLSGTPTTAKRGRPLKTTATANVVPKKSLFNLDCLADKKSPIEILGVKRGIFPGQGPVAHIRYADTQEEEYISTSILKTEHSQELVTYYEGYLNLQP